MHLWLKWQSMAGPCESSVSDMCPPIAPAAGYTPSQAEPGTKGAIGAIGAIDSGTGLRARGACPLPRGPSQPLLPLPPRIGPRSRWSSSRPRGSRLQPGSCGPPQAHRPGLASSPSTPAETGSSK